MERRGSRDDWPISLEDVIEARRRIGEHLTPTALRHYARLDDAVGLRVLVKHENHQPTNAFKVRNALAALTAMSEGERRRGVVAATMGNHGLGVAWAGRRLGVGVTICVPRNANAGKIASLRALGAEIVREGADYDESLVVMEGLVERRGLAPIHGINHPMMPAGAGTIALEALEQAEAMGEQIGAMVFAIGGGSQAVGAMTVVRGRGLDAEVFGAQAAGAPAMHDAWRRGEAGRGPKPRTIADGVATGRTYVLTFAALREGLRDFVLVSEGEIGAAMRLVIGLCGNLVEPAGVIGVAALAKLREHLAGRTVLVVLSGANVEMDVLRGVLTTRDDGGDKS